MTSYALLGITKYLKLNTGKLPVNSRTAKLRKNRKHRTANREPQTENDIVAPGDPRHPAPARQPPANGKSRNSYDILRFYFDFALKL